MKKFLLFAFISLLLPLCTVSCKPEREMHRKLRQIDKNIRKNPEQAIQKLAELHVLMEEEPQDVRMKYDLLRTKAADKAFVLHTSDSIMKRVADYYSHHGTPEERLEAFYYMGSVYRDLHDSPQAVVWYTRAAEYGEKHLQEIDSVTLACVYSQLGGIMAFQGNSKEALKATKRQYHLEAKRDSEWVADMDLAHAFKYDGQKDSAAVYYRRALDWCEQKSKSAVDITNVAGGIMNFYMEYHYPKSMIDHCFYLLNRYSPKELPRTALAAKAVYYDTYDHRPDSAEYYWKQVYNIVKEIGQINFVAEKLFRFYTKHHDPAKALEYAQIYMETADSIARTIEIQQTANAYNEYVYRKNREQEAQLQRRIYLLAAGGTILLLVAGGLLWKVRRLQKEKTALAEENRLPDSTDHAGLPHPPAPTQPEEEPTEKPAAINLYATDTYLQLYDHATQRKSLKKGSPLLREYVRLVELADPALKRNVLDKLKDCDLQTRQIACLAFTHFKQSQIARLLNISSSTVTRRMERINEKTKHPLPEEEEEEWRG